ncbi:MAG: hypothetical protein M3O71_21755 [Bacteroidota bacterium]|nr:hypothetical protein [Bacteroidota bacterium]
MKLKYLSVLFLSALVFASCSHVYTPALYHQDIAYQPKPTSFDTAKSLTYVSAGLGGYTNTNLNDVLISGQLNLSRGHVFNNFNIAYGGFAVFGDYQNGSNDKTQPNYFSDKFFGAVGGRFSANAFVTNGNVDFRFIGMEMAYSHEFGGYADFRKSIDKQGGYYVDPRTDLFSIGLTTEVIFHNRNDNTFQHGIRGFLGTTVGHDQLDDTYYNTNNSSSKFLHHIYPKASYFITFKDFFGTFEVGSAVFLRFGYKF